jgi:exonuclease III
VIITTWNIRHGGGKRVKDIIQVISENSETDIFVLTEYRNNSNKTYITSELNKLGYTFQYNPNSCPTLNSVLIASKTNFKVKTFDILKENKQRVIKLYNDDLSIYGCYFPLKNLKKSVFEFLLSEINNNEDENIIIVGDFNTGKHYLDEKGKSFYCSEYFDKLEQVNMIDAWRFINGDTKEFSWFSNAENGFRLDHFFLKSSLKKKIKSCEYIHKYREEKISDHSMMKLKIE